MIVEGRAAGRPSYFFSDQPVERPSRIKWIASKAAFPLLCLLSREATLRIGLVPIDDERVIAALRHARGNVLDVGCGANRLVQAHGEGVGVDVVAWRGADAVADGSELPVAAASFDAVAYLASLNHIRAREAALLEAFRVLRPGGIVLVTMIPRQLGGLIHWIRRRNDADHRVRGAAHHHELLGMTAREVGDALRAAGFRSVRSERFAWGFNAIFIAEKAQAA